MSPERFDHLLNLVGHFIQKKRCNSRASISPGERLTLTLRYLATGDSQQSQSFNFRVGRSTASMIIKDTCDAIWTALSPTYLKTPSSEEEWMAIAKEFMAEWNFPHVVGAVDGKHICIECPKNGGSLFYNYKHFHSTVLMAICDAKYRFTSVSLGDYGRDNDAAIFSQSDIFKAIESGKMFIPQPSLVNNKVLPYTLVGDEIFPLKTWLMKPYPGKGLSESQNVFNYRLSRCRRTIENAFGIYAARWRIFRRPIRASISTVDAIVKATLCLHNYLCMTENAQYIPTGFVDCDSSSGMKEGEWRNIVRGANSGFQNMSRTGSPNYSIDAKATRDNFCEYVNSEDGALPWQLDHVRSCGKRNKQKCQV